LIQVYNTAILTFVASFFGSPWIVTLWIMDKKSWN